MSERLTETYQYTEQIDSYRDDVGERPLYRHYITIRSQVCPEDFLSGSGRSRIDYSPRRG